MVTSFNDLIAEFDARVGTRPADPETFFAVEPIFRMVLDERLYIDRMNAVLRSVLDRTKRTNALLTAGTFMSLHSSDQSTWIVMEHRRRSQFLYMTPVHALLSPVAGPGYAVDHYRLTSDVPFAQVGNDAKIEHVRKDWLAPLTIAKKAGNGEILDVLVDPSGSRSFSLRASSAPLAPFQINFDRTTQSIFGLTPVNPMLSNLTTIFDLLADVSSPTSIDCLKPFAQHEDHFVRWRAIRSIYTIDGPIGRRLIEEARSDPHEQVRAAAATTLSRLPA